MAVFPTCVGVFLFSGEVRRPEKSLPHVRGGVSAIIRYRKHEALSSPRAWGCFRLNERSAQFLIVFPTCVGVFPSSREQTYLCPGLPHVRGGVSFYAWCEKMGWRSSPRAWGCFLYPDSSH